MLGSGFQLAARRRGDEQRATRDHGSQQRYRSRRRARDRRQRWARRRALLQRRASGRRARDQREDPGRSGRNRGWAAAGRHGGDAERTLTPAPGASLSGVSGVSLSWATGSLPVQGRDFSAFNLDLPSVSLHGFDSATHAMSFIASPQPLAVTSVSATVPVGATSASGYAVELRYPGVFFLDGETGGACGRTQRFIYAK